MQSGPWLKLKPREIEKTFMQVVYDLDRILVFDSIEMLETQFRILSHDIYGPLPQIMIEDTQDRYPVLEQIALKTAQLCAIVGMRSDIVRMYPGCEFLPPTVTDEGYLVGLRYLGRTTLAEDRTHWEAYHRLVEKLGNRIV